jgi:hypothetical protein
MVQQVLATAGLGSAVVFRCIEECERCHRTCLRAAMTYCLEEGVDDVEPSHVRALLTCSDMCRATINALLSVRDPTGPASALCARVCLECAESCERAGGLQDCVDACRRCARACAAV